MDKASEASGERSNEVLSSSEVPTLVNGHQKKQELQPLQSQVAGHSAANGASSLGMLLHPEGYVMKPAEKKVQGENEIRFYQHLQSASDPLSQELKNYVPCFYGTRSVLLGGKDILCIVLENVTDGMCKPCVMDVKIGKQTWEPSASEAKKRVEQAKYVESKKECGFCIPGMQFYDIRNGQLVKYGKEYGKTLDGNGIKEALKLFLNWKTSITRPLIQLFLSKLWKILRWFQLQKKFRFYSSSILFVYDAKQFEFYGSTLLDHLDATSMPFAAPYSQDPDTWKDADLCCDDELPSQWVNVKMIDFAHTLIANESDMDSNYVEGLQSLVRMFEILLQESY